MPAIAHRLAGLAPGQTRTRTAAVPVALELRLDVLELLATVLAVGVVTVLVGRLVIAPVAPRGVVRRTLVVGLEVGRVFSGVDRLGKRIAGLRTDRATREGADDRAGRTQIGRAHG